ncbi:MAG TPA: hypothetical protein VEL28_13210 [Candidatus Binatia bacterium]|nr:hypothetical protein [Candidatus Binatia bacterium]
MGGIYAYRLRASGCSIEDNVVEPCDDPFLCSDVASVNKPRLRDTSCGTSSQIGPAPSFEVVGTWGLCADG